MPKITQHSIDQVFADAQIEHIVGRFIELKKEGKNFKALSPFTNEKTPSFTVSPAKNIFKCFSSGHGGNAVTFVMLHKNASYPEAIKIVADICNITLEYENETPEQEKHRKQKEKTTAEYQKMVAAAARKFHLELLNNLEDAKHLGAKEAKHRQLTKETIGQWCVGYAPGGRFLYDTMLEKGLKQPGQLLSLLGEKGDKFQKRMVYPIQDLKGNYIGLAGRDLVNELNEYGKPKWPKHLNPADTPIYDKSRVLYGLNFAADTIQKTGTAYLTEGYNDVIAMHQEGICNTVASCGTNLTEGQVKLLKRFAKTVCLMFDADNAGIKACSKAMPMLLKAGLHVQVCFLDEGQDPDSFIRGGGVIVDYIAECTDDALLQLSERMYTQATNPREKQTAVDTIAEWLCLIDADYTRDEYTNLIAKALKITKKLLQGAVKKTSDQIVQAAPDDKLDWTNRLPKSVDKEEVLKYGFYGLIDGNETGYYFRTDSEGTFKSVSNFVITPLFHKFDQDDNTRIIKLDDGRGNTEIVEMPSKALISVDQFKSFLFDKGAFFFDGTKTHLDKLNKRYLYEFPKAFELKTLGWQPEGFFAFYNASYNGKLENFNEIGIVKHGNQHFFSPAFSDIYADYRKEDDMFENDRYLEHIDTPINFSYWAKLMHQVYEQHAYAAVVFVILSLFRDIVFKVDNNAPFLYAYGPSQSGKSKLCESVSNAFFKQMSAFNLNSGTDFAFAARLSRFRNCPVFFNEFDDGVVKDEWFQAIKGAYDGEGRERGKGGSKKKTEIQRVNCALVLAGQYLSTKDDNSVLSRSILRAFRKSEDRSDEQVKKYNHLKELEKEGLAGMLTEIMAKRSDVEAMYYDAFNVNYKAIIEQCRKRKKQYNERVVRNYSALVTLNNLFTAWVKLPWQIDEYMAWATQEVITLSGMIAQNDILTDFWTTIETLVGMGELREGKHFKVEELRTYRKSIEGKDEKVELAQSTELLYIRLSNVQQLYAKFKRSTGGQPMDITSLSTYLKQRAYYMGYVNSERFTSRTRGTMGEAATESHTSSAYIFNYAELGISIIKEAAPF